MVTFHNRDPRPARPKESFRSGRIDFDRISAQTFGSATGAWLLARPTLTDAHGIRVRARGTKSGPRFSGDMGLLEQYADRLSALESADLSPVDHEAEWARIYDDLSTTNRARSNS